MTSRRQRQHVYCLTCGKSMSRWSSCSSRRRLIGGDNTSAASLTIYRCRGGLDVLNVDVWWGHICALSAVRRYRGCFIVFHIDVSSTIITSHAVHQCHNDLDTLHVDISSTAANSTTATSLPPHTQFISTAVILMFFKSTYRRRRQHVHRLTRGLSLPQ